MACCISSSSTDSLNADIPGAPCHVSKVEGDIKEGDVYLITMKIVAYEDRFIIDFGLDNTCKDIALRVAAQRSTASLGRNSRIKRVWGMEETSLESKVELSWTKDIEIQVFFITESIFIAFDGIHVAKYQNRLPSDRIRIMEIRGNLTNIAVERRNIADYPLRRTSIPNICEVRNDNAVTPKVENVEAAALTFLPLPYYATFDEQYFKPGYSVVVKARVANRPTMFKVALQVGQSTWPPPTIAMQLEFHFNRKGDDGPFMVFNTFSNDKWLGEVRTKSKIKLPAKASFILVIVRGEQAYRIYLSEDHLYDYAYLMNPSCVNTCYVDGDIFPTDVSVESN